MTQDDLNVASSFGVPQWGIFKNDNTPVLETNSVLSVEYARDYKISDYPQEKGAFQSYNKVKVPFQAKVTFIISDLRQDFLRNVERAVDALDFVTVVTPDVQYPSANLTHYDYRRQKENASLIAVTVWCEEVRIAGQTQLTNTNTGSNVKSTEPGSAFEGQNTQSTNGASTSQNGSVQPAAPEAPTAATVTEPPT